MYIFDTDHISVFDRGGASAQVLLSKLAIVDPNQVATTIVTYEEQMRGWLSYTAKAESIASQISAYQKLERHLSNYQQIRVISFDDRAGEVFEKIRKDYPRLGSMDLKIAAIAIVHDAVLLTRNFKDFRPIQGLTIEDWTS
jgi:tRNA(fMet)-specific endonuclease VapC